MSSSPAPDPTPRLTLGTAGHIDHGKTAVVRALTGVDCDRLPEEKRRGITIELGFASLELEGGLKLSVIDVPGHERLVRTMVAGATGIDLVLLVVAADEGVMPQTREHSAVCDLLGIKHGVVALSKVDLVDEEMRELAEEDVRDLLASTELAGARIVPVSARTGEGLEVLRSALRDAAAEAAPSTPRSGPPRLGIDRAFAIKGFGTVATGTLVGSALEVGQSVEIHPRGLRARVRGLQLHGQKAERVEAGARCAVNLQGVDLDELSRGDVISLPGALHASKMLDVELRWLAGAAHPANDASIEFLAGAAERRAHLAPIGAPAVVPGERGFARIHLDDGAVALLPGDRFIARGFARSQAAGATLAGGVVLDTNPPHRRRSNPTLLRELEIFATGELESAIVERVRRTGLAGLDQMALGREIGLNASSLASRMSTIEESGSIVAAGSATWISGDTMARLEERLGTALAAFHAAEPLRPGMARAALLGTLPDNVPGEAADAALGRLAARGDLTLEHDLVRRAGYEPQLDQETQTLIDRIRNQAATSKLEAPSPRDWAEQLRLAPERLRDLLAHLERSGTLIRAPGDLWFDAQAVHSLCEQVVAYLREHERIDPAAYKALTGTTRRTTVPLMELLDELHITRRDGDARVLRRPG